MKSLSLLGYVSWWDESTGEGEIYCPSERKAYYVHWSSLHPSSPSGRRNLRKHQPVQFGLYTNLYMSQVEWARELEYSYDTETEALLNSLMNDAFEDGCEFVFTLADNYYKAGA